MTPTNTTMVGPQELATAVASAVAAGRRFAGIVASAGMDGSTELMAWLAGAGDLVPIATILEGSVRCYPSLSMQVPSAQWYEREIHDLFGVVPEGHPYLAPLVLPATAPGGRRFWPRPGGGGPQPRVGDLVPPPAPPHVMAEGQFTIPYGPVRSGVFESVEYLVETIGEDIPHLGIRVHYKHRGLERRFEELTFDQAALLAERVEGTASVAHALAFCQCLESLSAATPPRAALLVRVVHAELERIASHLDTIVRHAEAAGQAVALARFSYHKERLMRLRSALCGNRFGRGVVAPGGVRAAPSCRPDDALSTLNALAGAIVRDLTLLMDTPSFVDRLRGTGLLPPAVAAQHGALGPVGRGSGLSEDVRLSRPYGAYSLLGFEPAPVELEGDALARQRVRIGEIESSVHLIRQGLDELAAIGPGQWRLPLGAIEGTALGWAEAPQGELLYLVKVNDNRLVRVKPRTASFHNLALFPKAFRGDITTDFAFIEASFGLSVAGVSG